MKIFLLKLRTANPSRDMLVTGLVIRASGECEAREIACRYSNEWRAHAWIDPTIAACIELKPKGRAGVLGMD